VLKVEAAAGAVAAREGRGARLAAERRVERAAGVTEVRRREVMVKIVVGRVVVE
jgi:hypothetical protein